MDAYLEEIGMARRLLGGMAAGLVFFAWCSAAGRGDDRCWQLVYRAIERSAASPHSPFVTYREHINVLRDGGRFEQSDATITYRDDGVAYVDDDRWVHPFLSSTLDPGPPVLGPYGDRRSAWLSLLDQETEGLKVIAQTQNHNRTECIDLGDTQWDGQTVAHLVLPDASKDRPSLKAMWVDRKSYAMTHVVVSQFLNFYTEEGFTHKLTDYDIDLARIDGFDVIRRIGWTYSYRVFSQPTTLLAEYTFSDYRFASEAPRGTLFTR